MLQSWERNVQDESDAFTLFHMVYQFNCGTDLVSADTLSPGYRYLQLGQKSLRTII